MGRNSDHIDTMGREYYYINMVLKFILKLGFQVQNLVVTAHIILYHIVFPLVPFESLEKWNIKTLPALISLCPLPSLRLAQCTFEILRGCCQLSESD